MSAPPGLFRHADQFDLIPCPVPIEESSISVRCAEAMEASDAFQFSDRFLFFNASTGQVKSKEEILATPPDLDGFSGESKRFLELQHEKVASALSSYVGWSLCVRDNEMPTSESDVLVRFGVEGQTRKRIDEYSGRRIFEGFAGLELGKRRGRPRKQELALEAYNAIFPNGHGEEGIAFKTAVARVIDVIGQEISQDTLLRALGKKN